MSDEEYFDKWDEYVYGKLKFDRSKHIEFANQST